MGGSGGGGGYYQGGGGSGGGGSGGGGSGGGGGGPEGGNPCDLVLDATIHAPDTDYVDQLNLGTILDVGLGGPNGRTIEVRTSRGYLIGSLIGFTLAGQLVDCILQGNTYKAKVVRIEGGVFGVLVTRAAAP